jgi:putative heme-binding domain-containing protein
MSDFVNKCLVRPFLIVGFGVLLIGSVWAEQGSQDQGRSARTPEQIVAKWRFSEGQHGWTPLRRVELATTDAGLRARPTGNDPQMRRAVKAKAGSLALVVEARSDQGTTGQLFWTTQRHEHTSADRQRRFDIKSDGQWHTYKVYFETETPLTSLRLDPGTGSTAVEFRSIRLMYDQPPPPQATPVSQLTLPSGFEAELLYSVPKREQGSWVAMAFDDRDRLFVSDQFGGLYRVAIPSLAPANEFQVHSLDLDIGEAQGLEWAFGHLYAIVNGDAAKGPGLYRLSDTDGDNTLDEVKLLRQLEMRVPPGAEHGPHSVVEGPDGKSLFVVAGNMTGPPSGGWEASRVPQNWAEDLLLPRIPASNGHASDIMAPGGWISKVSPDGERWQLWASGFRNVYDIAFDESGELFAYDSDMEFDVGMPWYRPTRVYHVISGAQFGWRNGSGKWPKYFPDNLPPVVETGRGSPTGMFFAEEAAFPKNYKDNLFILDWTRGRILNVELQPEGASFTASKNTFLKGQPLPLADAVIGPDGAMYVLTGGRRTQSGLYRIRYTGETKALAGGDAVSRADQDRGEAGQRKASSELKALRRRLAQYHGQRGREAIATAWPHLDHEDRFVRFAARTAIEHQPLKWWRDKALAEDDPQAAIQALLAVARHADADLQRRIVAALHRIEWKPLAVQQRLALLRVYGLTFSRMGEPTASMRKSIANRFAEFYPADKPRLNRELSRFLGYLEAPRFIDKTLGLIEQTSDPAQQIHYAYILRAVKSGWRPQERKRFFAWLNDARLTTESAVGEHVYRDMMGRYQRLYDEYLSMLRRRALNNVPNQAKKNLKEVLAGWTEAKPRSELAKIEPRTEVRHAWSMEDFRPVLDDGLEDRNYARGRRMFAAAKCFQCHQFNGKGGIIGPDLTNVGQRYSKRYILKSIIRPNAAVTQRHQTDLIETSDGRQIMGQIVERTSDHLVVATNMMTPQKRVKVDRNTVVSTEKTPTSFMPPGALNVLDREEALDLLAYLLSGGNPEDHRFQ